MFVRTLLLSTCLAAILAVVGVSGASAGGFDMPAVLSAAPPLTQTDLNLTCHLTPEGALYVLQCHNVDPNPNPPKDTKSLSIRDNGAILKATAYPDGRVVVTGRVKASKVT
jgi:hypothetical protein